MIPTGFLNEFFSTRSMTASGSNEWDELMSRERFFRLRFGSQQEKMVGALRFERTTF